MRVLLAASAAVSALTLSAPAWAQPYPSQGYPSPQQGYPDQQQGYPGDADAGDYGPAPYDQAGPDGQDMGAYDDSGQPDAYGPDDGYGPSMPSEQYGAGPDTADRGAPQYAPYENQPSAPVTRYATPGYAAPPPRAMPAMPQYEAGVPRDILKREARLERRIQGGGQRGLVPAFHVDNLMVQLDSIRAQQDELARRDGGLNPTDRAFIESRLARLETNVTW